MTNSLDEIIEYSLLNNIEQYRIGLPIINNKYYENKNENEIEREICIVFNICNIVNARFPLEEESTTELRDN